MAPIDTVIRTESKRPIKLIPLPVLSDSSLEEIADKVYTSTLEVLESANLFTEKEFLKFCKKGDLERLVSVAVYVSGRHFRMLETVVQVIIVISCCFQ